MQVQVQEEYSSEQEELAPTEYSEQVVSMEQEQVPLTVAVLS